MKMPESIAHTTWICKYHVVWIPKYRKKQLFGLIRTELAPVMKELAGQNESEILQGALMPNHVHMLIAIPQKYAVSSVIGYIKGKSAIYIARNFRGKKRNFVGESFWARGYFVSTIGLDEGMIRNYIKNQEKEDKRIEQLSLLNM